MGVTVLGMDIVCEASGHQVVPMAPNFCITPGAAQSARLRSAPSTDVVVAGSAAAPYRQRVRELDVSVRVGPVRKLLRMFGPSQSSVNRKPRAPLDPFPHSALNAIR